MSTKDKNPRIGGGGFDSGASLMSNSQHNENPKHNQGFYERNQFIIYRLEHPPQRPGEIKKVPLNPFTFFPHSPHDPSIWMHFETASIISRAKGDGYGVGFVFTENDPFFFIDIDHCKLTGGTWSQHAIVTCRQFEGCFIEASASGNGLHIIGRYSGPEPSHTCDNKAIKTQFYTSKRFVALTWSGHRGNPDKDATIQLSQFIGTHFPASTTSTTDTEWTTAPTSEWNGPVDDNELIDMMLNSKSGGSVFGGRASIQGLWCASDTLGQYYPDPGGQRPFDWSSADAALCQHLAFWTGKNCERIDRMFRMSGLMRDKWEDREDYSKGTVLKAVGICQQVLKSQPTITEQWEPLISLDRPTLPTFTADDYPAELWQIIEAVATALEVPVELPGLLVLAVLATACQKTFIILVEPGYSEPLCLWTLCVLDSGSRKSATLKLIIKPLTMWEITEGNRLAPVIERAKLERKSNTARLKKLEKEYAAMDDPGQREKNTIRNGGNSEGFKANT